MTEKTRNIIGVRPIPALDTDDPDVQDVVALLRDAGYDVSKHHEEDLWTIAIPYEHSDAFE
jgi:hypothetical protein